ncbi:hypothetical protein TSAR_014889, partial [Trichomalopsis sarcophagae]
MTARRSRSGGFNKVSRATAWSVAYERFIPTNREDGEITGSSTT